MKPYVKPEMTIDEIHMNEAIAQCTQGKGTFTITFIGYGHRYTGGYSNAVSDEITDYAAAVDKYCDPQNGRTEKDLCRVYYISNGTCSAYYEDYKDDNGYYDGSIGDITSGLNWGGPVPPDNWQNVANMQQGWVGTFIS